MNLALSQYQDAFAQLLLADDAVQPADVQGNAAPPMVAALASQPGFAVYRNTVLKGCVDALAANYPAVQRLVGEEWFRAAAALYARARPPVQPALIYYGEGFADFLAGFAPAAELPYLPGVAMLDRLWTQAHAAADCAAATAADLARLAQLPPDVLMASTLRPHPAARWRWIDQVPAYTIWRRSREESEEGGEVEWVGEGALLTRPQSAVQWRAASRAECAFLDACTAGVPVAQAALAALACDAQADLPALIGGLIAAGAFAALDAGAPSSPDTTTPIPEALA